MKEICPICGAYSRKSCDIAQVSGDEDAECLWDELDPDRLLEDKKERERMNAEYGDDCNDQ